MKTEKLIRIGQYIINIEKYTTIVEEDEFFPEYKEIRLRLTCPHKNYEVSLMKNHWSPDRANDKTNYREVATIDLKDDNYIEDGYRWMIGDKTGKEVLKECLAAYAMFDDIDTFHNSFYQD